MIPERSRSAPADPRLAHHGAVIELFLFRTGGVSIVRSAFMPWLESPMREEKVYAPVWSALLRTSGV